MAKTARTTWRYSLWSAGPVVTAAAALGLLLDSRGLALAAILSLPWLAWRYDNESGTFLVLAVLFLIMLAVPMLLLALMSVPHR